MSHPVSTPPAPPPPTPPCDTGSVRYDGLRPYGSPGAEAGPRPRGSEADGGVILGFDKDDLLPNSAAKEVTLSLEAAAPCGRGCNPVWWRLQPRVTGDTA